MLVSKLPSPKGHKPLAVPLSIRIFQKCIEHKIDFSLVRHLHFFDLQCLIFRFEIQRVEDYLNYADKQSMKAQGIKEIKDISGNEALKFLRGE